VLAEHPDLSQRLTRQELDAIMDPSSYLGIAGESACAVAQKILARGDIEASHVGPNMPRPLRSLNPRAAWQSGSRPLRRALLAAP
jgi:hypothetical protein